MADWGISKLTVRPTLAVVLRYGLAVLLVAIALAIAVITHLHHSPPRFVSHFVLLAIAITFWCAGTGPGLLALLLSCLGVAVLARTHFLTPDFPLGSFLVFFVVFSMVLSLFTASRRRALQELRKARDELEIKVAERTAELVRRERELRDLLDSIPAVVWSAQSDGSNSYVNRRFLEYCGMPPEQIAGSGWHAATHPDDLERHNAEWLVCVGSGKPLEDEVRFRRADGQYRWHLQRGIPLRDQAGTIIKWYGVLTDIEDRKRAEEALRTSEAHLAEAQRISHTGSFGWSVLSGEIYWSEETYDIFEQGRMVRPTLELVFLRIHPDDRDLVRETIDHATEKMEDFDLEHRLLMPDGRVKHLRVLARAGKTFSRNLEYVGAVTDVTAAKQAEDKLRQGEMELRQILDFAPQHVAVLGNDRDRTRLYANQRVIDYFGLTLDEWRTSDRRNYYHPDDWERVTSESQSKFLSGIPHEYEARFQGKDGTYRWFLFRWNPLRDEQGRVTRWYATATDIEERKQAEQRLQNENVALREEIDKASMFEEIVGSSDALRHVLIQVEKVAPADSTVLITGETGTGKELIARAIHKRSKRAGQTFISVNCASIPASLIASELFGHEKGAFTGALQRRQGRFELAHGGTIFLDEVGELPLEMQIALLRVLQERQFERVGGNRVLETDVRVIAATNRDLVAAKEAGTFRADLFYRLNVFPIEAPALRQRAEDIPVLVDYFVRRYGQKAGKRIKNIRKRTLELFQAYDWPGNVRELQNVVERAIVLSNDETFFVDESWLKPQSRQQSGGVPTDRNLIGLPLVKDLIEREKEMIEIALREAEGVVGGPAGAAAKLGIPRETLNSKIRKLGIKRYLFKRS